VVLDANFDADTLHLLRARVTAGAQSAGMTADRASEVMLAVSELAGNTIRHGPGRGRLRIRLADGLLRCLVSDDGPGSGTWPVRRGHGLWVVRLLADQVTVSAGPGGSLVTAAFAITR
jgi:anti-sigma regulatory factor (Ser/Thr protein kinase)